MSFICEERLFFFDVNMKRERETKFFFKDNEFFKFFYGVTAAAHKHKFNRNYLSIFIF